MLTRLGASFGGIGGTVWIDGVGTGWFGWRIASGICEMFGRAEVVYGGSGRFSTVKRSCGSRACACIGDAILGL
jgi:hypothetical protein